MHNSIIKSDEVQINIKQRIGLHFVSSVTTGHLFCVLALSITSRETDLLMGPVVSEAIFGMW